MSPAQRIMQQPCPDCPGQVPYSAEECPVCKSRSLGPPNVRWAERPDERAALQQRVDCAEAKARTEGRSLELEAFKVALSHARVVMNRHLMVLQSWVSESNPFFVSFYRQVQQGRIPNCTEWDEQRGAAEQTINPWCHQDLIYAALTLNDKGMDYYGAYTVILRLSTIEKRSSVFEENPFYFNKRHNVISGESPPSGYRAGWANRAALAVAKVGDRIPRGASSEDFNKALMEQDGNKADCDFVEVHIHGSIHWQSIESVSGPLPKRAADRRLWKQLSRVLAQAGTRVEQL